MTCLIVPVKILYASVSNGETGDGSSGSSLPNVSNVIVPREEVEVLPEIESHASSFMENLGRILEVRREIRLDLMEATLLSTAMRWFITA